MLAADLSKRERNLMGVGVVKEAVQAMKRAVRSSWIEVLDGDDDGKGRFAGFDTGPTSSQWSRQA